MGRFEVKRLSLVLEPALREIKHVEEEETVFLALYAVFGCQARLTLRLHGSRQESLQYCTSFNHEGVIPYRRICR